MKTKVFDSELQILSLLWERGEMPAKAIAEELGVQVGWSKTTTYTVLKKCIDKQLVQRREPGFTCSPLLSREAVQQQETDSLVERLFSNNQSWLIASLLGAKKLTQEQLDALRRIAEDHDEPT